MRRTASLALLVGLGLLSCAFSAAAEDDGTWSKAAGSLIQQAKMLGRSKPAPPRKADVGLAAALLPVLQNVLARAKVLRVDLFRRPNAYLDVQFYGAMNGVSPEIAQRLYRSDAADWSRPDAQGDSVARFLADRLGGEADAAQAASLLATLKNQLVQPGVFHTTAILGGVDPFSSPSLVYFYAGEGSEAVPADVRAMGDALFQEGRASWSDPKKLCGSITYPPSEKGERPAVQNLYVQQECTCMARALRAAMIKRGLAHYTVGLMKLAQVPDAELEPANRKYPGDPAAAHLGIPPFLSAGAVKPDKVGMFKLDSVAPGLPLSSKADPDPAVKPTPPDSWNFHVAEAFRIGGETYVLDPITSRTALTLKGWMEKFENPKGRLLVESIDPVR